MSVPEQRWVVADALRPQIIALLRRRGHSAADAEDVAAETVIRAACKADLEPERAHAWMSVVAVRLGIDEVRRRPRAEHLLRLAHSVAQPDVPQSLVDDRQEAAWVARRVAELPTRQRLVLEQRAEGVGPALIAERLGCSYKTVESLTSRARSTVRAALAAAGCLLGSALALGRRAPLAGAPAVLAAFGAAAALTSPAAPSGGGSELWGRTAPVHTAQVSPATSEAVGASTHQVQTAARHATGLLRAHRTATRASTTPVAAAEARVSAVTVERTGSDESPVTSAVRCLRKGIVITTPEVGCPPPDQASVRG